MFAVFIFGHFQSQARNGLKTCDMGSWERKQEEKREVREREKTSRETLGKFFYDLAKLAFAALVIGSVASVVINKDNVDSWIIISIGVFVTYIFAYIGYKIIK